MRGQQSSTIIKKLYRIVEVKRELILKGLAIHRLISVPTLTY